MMSPASSIQKMQKLLMNIYKLISSLCESMQYLTHSRFCSFRLSSINSSPFAGAAASHQNVSDRKAREQHPGICDKCYTLHGNHAAFRQGPDEGRSTRLMAFPPQSFSQLFIQLRFCLQLKCTANIFDIFKEEIESIIEEDRPRIMASGRSYDINNYPLEEHGNGIGERDRERGYEDHNESYLTYYSREC